MFLIFDTETTGLPRNYKAPLTDFDNWPRMVQIAWQLHDINGSLINQQTFIVKPNGYTIPFNAEKIHGISNERAIQEGGDLKKILLSFLEDVSKCQYLCGHNIEFDIAIIGAELLRCSISENLNSKKIIDTKNDETTNYCALPGGRGGKYKWPTLTELYTKLFNSNFSDAHHAAFDVEATARVLFETIKRNIIAVSNMSAQSINYQAPNLSQVLLDNKQWKKAEEPLAINKTLNNSQFLEEKNSDNINAIKFTHLHNYTQFSVLQSTTDIDELILKALENKMPAVAITDIGNLYGAFTFWQAVSKKNKTLETPIKPIIGCELFVCKNHLDKSFQDNGYSQLLIAKNKIGFQNLSKLSSTGYIHGHYYVPRIDKELLQQHAEGLIATTGSILGEIPQLILNVGEEQAEQAFIWYKNIFKDDFYIELNRHLIEEENHVNEILLKFAKKYQVKFYAANVNYYLFKNGYDAHDNLLCVKNGEKKSTPIGKGRGYRYGLKSKEHYFKSPTEMAALFSDLPEAINNTKEIIDKVENYQLGREVLMPKFEIETQFIAQNNLEITNSYKRILDHKKINIDANNAQTAEIKTIAEQFIYLSHLTWIGAKKRYTNITSDIETRINFELSTVERMGYPGYFLIVSDFIAKGREMGVFVGPGRGSAAGSVIAYSLGITNIDPLKYNLLFERFLNPDRISMPDIDIDFDDEGREKVIQYVINKYGANQVAQIITYGTMGGKSAIKDTARVLDLPIEDSNKLSKSFPNSMEASLKALLNTNGIDKKYLDKIKDKADVIEQSHQFRKLLDTPNLQAKVLKQAAELEGCVRNIGTHACGIVITPEDIINVVPVTTASKDSNMLVTQYDNSVAEQAGLLKMDFLGLKTLTIIRDTLKAIKLNYNIEMDIDQIPLDDLKTLELFQRADTSGIFQYESAGMQKALREMKPDSFNDLIALNALYRPGPLAYIPNYIKRKHGKEAINFDLEGIEEYLGETYGITVYQEQVMLLSQKLANFSKGDADTLRKAMGKKDKATLDKMKSKFVENCVKNNHPADTVEKVWKDWEAFADYAFNKSHSTCYAYIGFQTAYLKAHYPVEYMSVVLQHSSNIDAITFFMDECNRLKIKILGPDINEGNAKFTPIKNKREIRFGMASIKGVGENTIANIIEERNLNGSFTSIFDVAKRLDSKSFNKKSIEGLALAGSFDSFGDGLHRAHFFVPDKNNQTLTDKLIKYCNANSSEQNKNQNNLFDSSELIVDVKPTIDNSIEPWNKLEILAKEKEVVGVFISGHPLDQYKLFLEYKCNINCLELSQNFEKYKNKDMLFAGIVTKQETRTSKNGHTYGKITLEDYHSTFELMLFGKDYIEFNKFMIPNIFISVKGRVQQRYNQPDNLELKVLQMQLLEDAKTNLFSNLKLNINIDSIDDAMINTLNNLFSKSKGKCNVEILIQDEQENFDLKMQYNKNNINVNLEMIEQLETINGLTLELS